MTTSARHADTATTVHVPRTMLVVGATGLVGRAALAHFANAAGWNVVALSRRVPEALHGVRHLAVDLADRDGCAAALRGLRGITHVLYAALHEKPDLLAGWLQPDQIDTNLAMLRNLLDAIDASPSRDALAHLTLLQGTKAYGSHVRRVPVPAKERWPRGDWPIFYWPQEDLLRERAARGGWAFTVLRPQLILGDAIGSPMNFVLALGTYAAIRRELGQPLSYPGGGRFVTAASDSRLIARAVEWCATRPQAAGRTFNLTDGDAVCWHDLWPSIAARFDLPVGPPEPQRLAQTMPAHEPTWRRIVERHGLRPTTLAALVGASWQFADRNLAAGQDDPPDRLASPIALRQAGFDGCEDTEDAIAYWIDRLQRERWLPR